MLTTTETFVYRSYISLDWHGTAGVIWIAARDGGSQYARRQLTYREAYELLRLLVASYRAPWDQQDYRPFGIGPVTVEPVRGDADSWLSIARPDCPIRVEASVLRSQLAHLLRRALVEVSDDRGLAAPVAALAAARSGVGPFGWAPDEEDAVDAVLATAVSA